MRPHPVPSRANFARLPRTSTQHEAATSYNGTCATEAASNEIWLPATHARMPDATTRRGTGMHASISDASHPPQNPTTGVHRWNQRQVSQVFIYILRYSK